MNNNVKIHLKNLNIYIRLVEGIQVHHICQWLINKKVDFQLYHKVVKVHL